MPEVQSLLVLPSVAGAKRVVLPSPGLVLGFRVGGSGAAIENGRRGALSSSALSGLRTTVREMITPTDGVTVVTVFRPLAAARFFRVPLHELFGQVVPLEQLLPRSLLAETEERLSAAPDASAQRDVVRALLARLRRNDAEDELARVAVNEIFRAHGNLRIDSLARSVGLSQDRFEKRFRQSVGATPKQLCSIVRFRSAISAAAHGRKLTDVAHEAGYFDHAHLARSFRAAAGVAPGAFLKREFCGSDDG